MQQLIGPAAGVINVIDGQAGSIQRADVAAFCLGAINDANFPYVSANVFDKKTGKHYFKPYIIKDYRFKDTDGKAHNIKVGYIGFVPPQIMVWDKKNLTGKVFTQDIKKSAAQKLMGLYESI